MTPLDVGRIPQETPHAPHHVTLEDASGWLYWQCHDCHWHTRPTMHPSLWQELAAQRHAAGDDREDDP